MKLNLAQKTALVCGSSKGIGLASAIALAGEGVLVTLVARNEKKLKEVVDLLPGSGHNYIVADFQTPKDLKRKVGTYITDHHGFDILINNTGGPKAGSVLDADLDEFESAFTQHLKCNHVLIQAVVPGMKNTGYGRIINIISTSVKQPLDGLGVSNTIRGAVANWSKTLANELAGYGITVNNILPGATATERLDEIINNKAAKSNLSKEEVEITMQNAVPMKRFAKPEEIANAVVFLASEAASYITGINLPVDGGRTKSL